MKEKTALSQLIDEVEKDILLNPYYRESQRLKLGATMVIIKAKELLELEKKQMGNSFDESRLTHPMIGFKHETFETYFTDTYEQPK